MGKLLTPTTCQHMKDTTTNFRDFFDRSLTRAKRQASWPAVKTAFKKFSFDAIEISTSNLTYSKPMLKPQHHQNITISLRAAGQSRDGISYLTSLLLLLLRMGKIFNF